ncbi:MAG: hypothetical protein WAT93_08320 [Pontixanthobacter sp.]
MIETNIHGGAQTATPNGADLRPIEWHALAAKLAAARDLRLMLSGNAQNAHGNFSHFTAGECAKLNKIATCVNPDALADGKCSGAKVVSAANGDQPIADLTMTQGDRELT